MFSFLLFPAANARKIQELTTLSVQTKAVEVLKTIYEEPGEEKMMFVQKVLNAAVQKPKEFETLIRLITEPMLKSVNKPSSIMPCHLYEDQLIFLNKFLNSPEAASILSDLKVLCDESRTDSIPTLVMSRLCFKLLDYILETQFKIMNDSSEAETDQDIPPAVDKECFNVHFRKLIQAYYVNGVKSDSNQLLRRCACIRRYFIESDVDIDNVQTICLNVSWESGNLKLNERLVDIFFHVEQYIQKFLTNKSDKEIVNIVFDNVLDNRMLLDQWGVLTADMYEEDESLVFLHDLVNLLVKLSVKLEIKKAREIEAQGKGTYALRTDLKRN